MQAYERLMKYIQYDTASDETSETCPSTAKQLVLAKALYADWYADVDPGVAAAELGADPGCISLGG